MADEEVTPLSTPTTNYGWAKPTVGGDGDAWGGMLNADLDGIDSVVHGIQASIPAPYVLPTASTTVLGGVKVDGTTITIASGVISGASASITISDTAPSSPAVGALWFNSAANNAQLYVYYNDGNSSQWVPTTNQLGGGYLQKAGVTDGSDAPAGQIGEVITTSTGASNVTSATAGTLGSITLSPGDWDVYGTANINRTNAATVTIAVAALTPSVNSTASAWSLIALPIASSTATINTPISPVRLSITSSTTVNVTVQVTFSASPCSCSGSIWARRAR